MITGTEVTKVSGVVVITVTFVTEPAYAVACSQIRSVITVGCVTEPACLSERGRRSLAHRDVSGSHVSGYPLSCVQTELGLSFDSKGQVRADTHGRGWVGVDLHRRGVGQVMWGGAVLKNAANSHSSTPTHVSWASSSGC